MSFDHLPQIRSVVWREDSLIGELHAFAIGSDDQFGALTAKKNFSAGVPSRRLKRGRARLQELFLQPRDVSLEKMSRLELGAAARNGHARRAVGSQAQNVSPRQSISEKTNGHGSRTNQQTFLTR